MVIERTPNDKIDCLIEEHIKGIPVVIEPYQFEGIRYAGKMMNETIHHSPLDHYSTDISKAWALISEFKLWYAYTKKDPRRQGMEWNFGNDLANVQIVTFVLIVTDGFKRHHFSAEGTTLERAICFAVLKAKGVDVEDDIMHAETVRLD